MEIADNQHPIDLSRKCGYYESSSYSKSIPPSRPLPGLIPISVLGSPLAQERADKKRDDLLHCFNAFSSSSSTTNDFQFKEQSKFRKELSRFRSVPHLPKSKISRLKSKSDSKISSISDTGSFYIRNVPITAGPSNRAEHSRNQTYSSFASSPLERNFCWKPPDDNDTSMHSMSAKNVKQGPGVSFSTIQSLRKLLDKRKSMHNN